MVASEGVLEEYKGAESEHSGSREAAWGSTEGSERAGESNAKHVGTGLFLLFVSRYSAMGLSSKHSSICKA